MLSMVLISPIPAWPPQGRKGTGGHSSIFLHVTPMAMMWRTQSHSNYLGILDPFLYSIPPHLRFILIFPSPNATKDKEIKHRQADMYNFIVTTFEDYSGSSYTKTDNEWYNKMKEDKIPYIPNNMNWTLDVRTSWAFANGKLSEDGDGGEHIECFCLSLLLVR